MTDQPNRAEAERRFDLAEMLGEELDTTISHIRSIIAGIEGGDVTLEGVSASLRGLLPERTIPEQMRAKGMGALADRMEQMLNRREPHD